jgi:hypothetical protein
MFFRINIAKKAISWFLPSIQLPFFDSRIKELIIPKDFPFQYSKLFIFVEE